MLELVGSHQIEEDVDGLVWEKRWMLGSYQHEGENGMQCVQAIHNCMKKVKAEYHNVIGLYHRKSAVNLTSYDHTY